jgi:hypothetical protein
MAMALSTKLSVAAVVGALTVGGLGVAAYAGGLPPGLQNAAHTLIAAPTAPRETDAPDKPHPAKPHQKTHPDKSHSNEKHSGKARPVGPDATGPAAFGLCTAYSHSTKHGKSVGHSMAMRNLAAVAGGMQRIDAYCAHVVRTHASERADAPKSKPTR